MSCIDTQEAQLIALVNQYRAQQGLLALRPSAILMQSAREWAQFMAEHDYFSHDGPDGSTHDSRARALGYPGSVGANILYGQPDADKAFLAWKNSPPHDANLRSPNYREVGIALAVEPTWSFQGDVYLAASLELGTGQSAPAEVCGTEPPVKPPVRPLPPPKAHLPTVPPPRPTKAERVAERKRLRLIERVRDRVRQAELRP